MKDALSLLAAGIAASVASWAFWHYLGADAGGALVIFLLAAGGVGGARRRRQLRARKGE